MSVPWRCDRDLRYIDRVADWRDRCQRDVRSHLSENGMPKTMCRSCCIRSLYMQTIVRFISLPSMCKPSSEICVLSMSIHSSWLLDSATAGSAPGGKGIMSILPLQKGAAVKGAKWRNVYRFLLESRRIGVTGQIAEELCLDGVIRIFLDRIGWPQFQTLFPDRFVSLAIGDCDIDHEIDRRCAHLEALNLFHDIHDRTETDDYLIPQGIEKETVGGGRIRIEEIPTPVEEIAIQVCSRPLVE